MKNKFNNIAIIGNSKKFIQIIKEIFPRAKIIIYSWRLLNQKKLSYNFAKKPDLIIVGGYDFRSFGYSYLDYYNVNITFPFNFIKSLLKSTTLVIYIDTINKLRSKKNIFTLSRYEFAKKKLCFQLYKTINTFRVLSLPVIKNNKNEAFIFGNRLTKFIFNIAINLKLIDSISLDNLKKKIIYTMRIESLRRPYSFSLKPLFLFIPRNHFIDRILRSVSG
jgi:hypothetical protein